MARKPLDTRRQRTPSAKSALKSLEESGRKVRTPLRTGRRPGISAGYRRAFPDKSETFPGTLPEWAIYWAHSVLRLTEGQDFVYISHIAGIQVDFEEFGLNIALNIQGLYWHYQFGGSGKQHEDLLTRATIEGTGTQLINVDEDMALDDPVYCLKEALAGRDHSRQARGMV